MSSMKTLCCWVIGAVVALGWGEKAHAQIKQPGDEVPKADRRSSETRHLDLKYSFPKYDTKTAWEIRAADLRLHILASAGLLPTPVLAPLKAHVFGKIDQGGYTVEKVYFESLPGVFVIGNLFRPKNIVGKVPAILNAHGHDRWGRIENTDLFGPVKRAASFAKLGMVSFLYDMIGYGDNLAIPHDPPFGGPREDIWGLSMMGVQLANSMRAVDFLMSLPEVDSERIGMTGESGGGTQTFITAAVDDRIKATAPVNMISSIMQGGCTCENAANLRIDAFNVELGALTAPRPMLMVSATGDWTKNTPQIEFPAIRGIYALYGQADRVSNVHTTAPHNYNQASREAAYGFFAHQFLGRKEATPLAEPVRTVPAPPDLLVFYGIARPKNEINAQQLTKTWISMAQQQLVQARPRDAETLIKYQSRFGVALKQAIGAELPVASDVVASPAGPDSGGNATAARYFLSRRNRGDRVPVAFWQPTHPNAQKATVLVAQVAPKTGSGDTPGGALVDSLLQTGHSVLVVSVFPGQDSAPTKTIKYRTTYNRTDAANQVQDILTALAHLRGQRPTDKIALVGVAGAGLASLLARAYDPALAGMAVDVEGFKNDSDDAFIEKLPIPGIRRAGDFLTASLADTQLPLLIHSTGRSFQTQTIAIAYRAVGHAGAFKSMAQPASVPQIVTWLDGLMVNPRTP